jgi:hypothetical protein
MSDRIRCRCSCRRCTIRSLMGPAVVITIGVLFLLDQMRGGYFSFGNTWPVVLIVIGAVLLASSLAPMEGHVSGTPAPPTPGSPSGPMPGQGQ